jgi:hypothetical protein
LTEPRRKGTKKHKCDLCGKPTDHYKVVAVLGDGRRLVAMRGVLRAKARAIAANSKPLRGYSLTEIRTTENFQY